MCLAMTAEEQTRMAMRRCRINDTEMAFGVHLSLTEAAKGRHGVSLWQGKELVKALLNLHHGLDGTALLISQQNVVEKWPHPKTARRWICDKFMFWRSSKQKEFAYDVTYVFSRMQVHISKYRINSSLTRSSNVLTTSINSRIEGVQIRATVHRRRPPYLSPLRTQQE
jgi:hypothetical protein